MKKIPYNNNEEKKVIVRYIAAKFPDKEIAKSEYDRAYLCDITEDQYNVLFGILKKYRILRKKILTKLVEKYIDEGYGHCELLAEHERKSTQNKGK